MVAPDSSEELVSWENLYIFLSVAWNHTQEFFADTHEMIY